MWVLTVFEKKSFRMFEFTTKAEAVKSTMSNSTMQSFPTR